MSTLLLFFDGIGIGRDDRDSNPFAAIDARRLAPLAGRVADTDANFRPLDATLGVPGLPQSATGQTTLLTGVNAARLLGHHATGLPGPSLRPVIERDSVFRKLVEAGKQPTFANAYTPEHFSASRPRWSTTTRVVQAAGVPFRMIEPHERRDEALPHDYTGEWWIRQGRKVKPRSAGQAAQVLAGLLETNDLVLYEYFMTDLVAHRGNRKQKVEQARRVERLVDALLEATDLERHRVLVTSDHGNLEQSDHARHTMNPVPLLAWGAGSSELVAQVTELEQVTPFLVEDLGGAPK
jgi:hypothetical protein